MLHFSKKKKLPVVKLKYKQKLHEVDTNKLNYKLLINSKHKLKVFRESVQGDFSAAIVIIFTGVHD